MLVLIQQLPADSAFKMACDWPLQAHLDAAVVNAINALRAELVPGTGYLPILPPSAQRELEQKRAQARAGHDQLMAQLRGE